ncbi:MarR family winged helix-turn-helix transcriptional regulator [Roseibium alexandrii]|uniref:Transcriptional regulator n=1 Tax=Roseibium alexandrii (strain DSM 17067 / NCIMB 14079 / DFL-11) TaxID=244592 RepID=A0A5E8H4D1_ROSAD|nr:MarR family transcriptional regulator [Roseibium alexandrii]EEE46988.1 Transcriptional regulator [Roseibium alexandrii DFL-11]
MAAHDTSAEPISKSRLRLWLRLLKATSGIETELRRRLRDECDTTLPRFDVLSALSRYPDGLKMSEISAFLKVSNGNVTGIVERLVEDGHAVRMAVPGDKRANRVKLTSEGHAIFADLAAKHEGWIDELMGGLDRTAIAACNEIFEQFGSSGEPETALKKAGRP